MNTQGITTIHVIMKGIVGTVTRNAVAVMKEVEETIMRHSNTEKVDDSTGQEAMEIMHVIGINKSAEFGM